MAKLKCNGGPADGREYDIKAPRRVAIMCRRDDTGEFCDALYRLELVFDGYSNDSELTAESRCEGQNS